MKAFFSTLIALTIISSLSANSRCERLDLYDLRDLKGSFEKDLVTNVWRSGLMGSLSTLYFQEDGLVISMSASKNDMQTYLWAVQTEDGRAVLTINDHQTDRKFVIAPTCTGISVVGEGRMHTLQLAGEAQISAEQLGFLRSRLVGKWQYEGTEAAKSYPVGFSLLLAKDGTYSLMTGPDMYHTGNTGVWQISPDGRFLILYSRISGGETRKYVPETIRLRSVDYEDMVIDSDQLPRVLEEYAGQHEIFLAKARP